MAGFGDRYFHGGLGDRYFHGRFGDRDDLSPGGCTSIFGPDVAIGALCPFLESVADLDNGMSVVAGGPGGLSRALAAVARSAGAEIRTVSPSRPPGISCHDREFHAGWLPHLGTKCDFCV